MTCINLSLHALMPTHLAFPHGSANALPDRIFERKGKAKRVIICRLPVIALNIQWHCQVKSHFHRGVL